jgi:hypothetical protein
MKELPDLRWFLRALCSDYPVWYMPHGIVILLQLEKEAL